MSRNPLHKEKKIQVSLLVVYLLTMFKAITTSLLPPGFLVVFYFMSNINLNISFPPTPQKSSKREF